jgi:hypothetical protein
MYSVLYSEIALSRKPFGIGKGKKGKVIPVQAVEALRVVRG